MCLRRRTGYGRRCQVGGSASKCRFLAAPMQDWTPSSSSYDVIWAQWCVGHLTDAHFLRFLQRCRTALKPRASSSSKTTAASRHPRTTVLVDDADRSICRGRAYLEALLALSGAELLCTALQPDCREDAFPADVIRCGPTRAGLMECVNTHYSLGRVRWQRGDSAGPGTPCTRDAPARVPSWAQEDFGVDAPRARLPSFFAAS